MDSPYVIDYTEDLSGPPPAYVAVGIDDYTVSVNRHTFDAGFIAFTIIFGIIIIAVVVSALVYAYYSNNINVNNSGTLLYVDDTPTMNSNVGSANFAADKTVGESNHLNQSMCSQLSNANWIGSSCICQHPFYGPTCSQEKHSSKYHAAGTPNLRTVTLDIIDEMVCTGKSFDINDKTNSNSCSTRCDNTKNCTGFIYRKSSPTDSTGVCSLLRSEVGVEAGATIPYSTTMESTLYMKNLKDLNFHDGIYLSNNEYNFPKRYWLMNETPKFTQLQPWVIKEIKFFPREIKIGGKRKYRGLYCLHDFTMEEVPILLSRQNDMTYVHESGTYLNVPAHWNIRGSMYVVYLPI
jgi:hypothetical protein